MLILPGTDLFDLALATIPPAWAWQDMGDNVSFVADVDSGLLRPVTPRDLEEYVLGGEYDQRLNHIEEDDELDWLDNDSNPEYD